MSLPPHNVHTEFVTSNERLAELCHGWLQLSVIALDTEFMRTDTFYPIAALFQVGDGDGCYLLDPLSITDFQPLKTVLQQPSITKVLHSCSEDLEVFRVFLDCVPTPLYDTQLAAAFLGKGISLGYQALVKLVLGYEVAKDETRSNWLQRPLTPAQQKYAALDVSYLLPIYELQTAGLRQQHRLAWLQADCARLLNNANAINGDNYYTKIKSAWKLNERELAILQSLCRWREEVARQRDVPRNRVIKERALWEIARAKPEEISVLAALDEMTPKAVRKDGQHLLRLVREAMAMPPEQCPAPLPKPLPPQMTAIMKQLRQRVRELAAELDISEEVLARKKDFEFLVRSGMSKEAYRLPASFSGWREQVLGPILLAQLQKVDDETD